MKNPAIVYEDNTSAIHIAEGTETTESRFLMTRIHQARQLVKDGEIEILHIPDRDQIADVLTKANDRASFVCTKNFYKRELFCSDRCSKKFEKRPVCEKHRVGIYRVEPCHPSGFVERFSVFQLARVKRIIKLGKT